MSYLRRKNILRKTIIVITADHGEALAENRVVGHGHSLNTVIQVPLIVYLPWNDQKHRISNIVELIDVAPSILKQLNIKIPKSFKGINIFNINDSIDKEFGFSQIGKWVMIRDKNYIFKEKAKYFSLYDLIRDPFEFTNIIEDNNERTENFMVAYRSFINNRSELKVESREIDHETIMQLKSLGYIK